MSTITPTRPPVSRPGSGAGVAARATSIASNIDPIRVLRRHLWLILSMAVIGGLLGVAGYVVALRVYTLYSGEVLFEVRPGLRDSTEVGSQEIINDNLVFRLAKTETLLLTSREVLTRALSNPEIRQTAWHKGFLKEDGTFGIEEAVDELEEAVNASVVRGTNLFTLKWSTHERADVPIVINNIARSYLDRRASADASIYNDNLELFRAQLAQTQRDLEDLTQEIKFFIREKGITTLLDSQYSQEAYSMREMTKNIADARQMLSVAQTSYLQTISKLEGTIEPTSEDRLEAERDPSLYRHMQEVVTLKTELRRLAERYRPDHALVLEAESRVRAAELERDAKLEEIMHRNLEAQAKDFGDEIESLQNMLDGLEDEFESTVMSLRELAGNQSQYEALENRRSHLEATRDADLQLIKEVQLMRLRSDASRVRTARWAMTPRQRSFPKIEIMIPLGILLCVGLTVAVIFLRELTDQRVKSASDLAVLPGANVLGVIPELDEDPTRAEAAELVVRRHPQSVLAESYRQACAPITRTMERCGYQLLMLASGLPGAGTTTAATNIAATAAAGGKRVLLVDANFRRPGLAQHLDASNEPGFGDALAGDIELDQAISGVGDGIFVMGAGSSGNRMFERLGNGAFDQLAAELRGRFDLVIFDTPPAVVAGEAMALASKVDAAVLVVRANQEQRGLVSRLLHQLSDAHCDLLGIILNRPRGTAGGYFKKNYAAMARYGAPTD
ncbi:MAG: GumC family protein [Planctomycetota bacterium]|jgi:capsular exopolysaccharide synthesis family protein